MLPTLRYCLFAFFCMVVCSADAWAQSSYLYIQGDRKIPFYVKKEGEMMRRYGKNYCIIPQLKKGPVHLEILFQQNMYPAEKFTLIAPADGGRGFLLVRKDERFALYDLQTKKYLVSNEERE